jgi:sugar/nucleoside kinase (ribokinase family)
MGWTLGSSCKVYRGVVFMEKQIDVLTFGDLCVDLILSGKDVVPEFGQKEKLIENYSLEMGGSCSIFACQAAKLGLRAAVLGGLGEDEFGQVILKTLKEAGVNTEYIKTHCSLKTGITTALNAGHDRAMITYNGTIDSIEPGDVPDELLEKVRHFHIGSYFLMKKIQPHYPQILKKLKEHGATISLDTNWDPEENWDSGIKDILQYVDIFFPNENEAVAITGEENADKAIEKLKEIVPVVAVKKGKYGAVVYANGEIYEENALSMNVVDTVGAGDSFDGGFIYGFLNRKTIEECVTIGCICGSLNTRFAGGVNGQPDINELEKWIDCYKDGGR